MNRDFILKTMLHLSAPFIILFAFYIILNGHSTPGGGFQGGAILAALFIIGYIISPEHTVNCSVLHRLEKVLYVGILLLALLLIARAFMTPSSLLFYNMAMNMLIGIKVCCGLTLVFYRFILFESR